MNLYINVSFALHSKLCSNLIFLQEVPQAALAMLAASVDIKQIIIIR